MQLTTSDKNIVKLAAALGIIQGLTWLIMNFICIGIYTNGVDYPETFTTYMEYVNHIIASRFLDSNFPDYTDYNITPLGFTVFMWLYVILNALWLLASINIFLIVTKEKYDLMPRSIGTWILLVYVISLIDVIFGILLGVDYSTCMDLVDDFFISDVVKISVQMDCANSTIPVIVILFKGFILWIVNAVLVVVLYLMAKRHNYNGIVVMLKGSK